MVDVFVHENGPLMRIERTKERMWVLGTASCARIGKAIDSSDELGALALEVALCEVRREEFRRGGRVTAHRLIIAEDQRLEKRADDVSGKGCAFGVDDAHRHQDARGTVCEGLGRGHLAPQPLTLRVEAHDASLCVFYQSGVKEIFHGSYRPSWVDYREGSQQLSTTWQEGLLFRFRSEESETI
jgi:hypothetical protein